MNKFIPLRHLSEKIELIKILFIVLIILFTGIPNLQAQQIPQYNLKDIIVTASRTPLSDSDLTRSVIVIDQNEIKQAPVNSVQGLLQYAAGVSLEQRGINGVQADVSIRGGNSEETLVMIDGVSISDPQTGHHTLNLPVSLNDIERIEILKGAGSSIYGANAFSGVINIITKKGNERSLSLQAEGGQNGYYSGSVYAAYPLAFLNNHFSLSKKKSDGFMHNTDFDITDFSYGASVNTGIGMTNLLFGYNDKKFGANSYYSVLFPNQWEHTTTKLLSLTGDFGSMDFTVSPKIYWRRNDDNYLLDYTNPPFYHNIHQTNIYGAELQLSVASEIGVTSFGGVYSTDKIESNNLGYHQRFKKGIFAEQKFSPLENLTVIANAFAYDYSAIGWKFWPGIDAGYRFTNSLHAFGSIGKAFRIPTYTELYYSSPVSVGNPNLKYEEMLNYEAGLNYNQQVYDAKVSVFRKEGKNLIDWVRNNSNDPWAARNITTLNTDGFELNLTLNTNEIISGSPVSRIGISYTYLNSDRSTDQFQSQYLLEYLRHQLIISVNNTLGFGIMQNWEIRYENRVSFNDYFLVDTKISRPVDQFEIYLKATNLFNKSYYEISGVPLPGRWITAGIKYSL